MPNWVTVKPGSKDNSGPQSDGGRWKTVVPPRAESLPEPAQSPLDTFTRFTSAVLGVGKDIFQGTVQAGVKLGLSVGEIPRQALRNPMTEVTPVDFGVTVFGKEIKSIQRRAFDRNVALEKGDITLKQSLGQSAGDVLDLAQFIPGVGGVARGATLLRGGGKEILKNVAKNAAVGAGYGAGYSGASAMEQNAPWDQVKESAVQGAKVGAIAGGALSAAGSGLSKVLEKRASKVASKKTSVIESAPKAQETKKVELPKPQEKRKTAMTEVFRGKDEIVSTKKREIDSRPLIRDIQGPQRKAESTNLQETMRKLGLSMGKNAPYDPPKVMTKADLGGKVPKPKLGREVAPPIIRTLKGVDRIPKEPKLPKMVKVKVAPTDRPSVEAFGESIKRQGGEFKVTGNEGVVKIPGKPTITFSMTGKKTKSFDQMVGEVKAKIAPVVDANEKKATEGIRKWMSFSHKEDLNGEPIKYLEKKRPGVASMKFDQDGNITLYRSGDVRHGEAQSYSTTKKFDSQKPYVIHRDEVLADLTSKEISDLFDRNYSGKERDMYKDGLKHWKGFESEVLVKRKEQVSKIVVPVKKVEPKASESQKVEVRKSGEAISKVDGTEESKTRGLAKGVEAKAIEKKLTDGFGDLPEYKGVSMKDQAEKASKIVNETPEYARKIALGEERPPEGVLPESVFVALEKQAHESGDVALLRDLATKSNLVTEATTMGQRIRSLGERNEDSVVANIQKIAKDRVDTFEKATGKTVAKAKKEVVSELESIVKKSAPKKEDWHTFINELEC
jgi:hypothetical protein